MSRSRKSIPIPSFSVQAVPINTEDEEMVEAIGVPIQEEDRIQVTLNKTGILGLDSALQLHLHKTKSARISYKDFCELVPKVIMSLPSSTSAPSEDPEPSLLDLSTEERLWHDLCCVGGPSLYKIVRSESSVSLETVPVSGNRFKEMRRLLEEAGSRGVLIKLSDEAKELISSLRQTVAAGKASTTVSGTAVVPKKKNDDSSNAIIKPEMDLFERVKAKAAQREKYLQEAEKTRKGPNTEDRVTLADALFGHARHVLRRRKQMQKGAAAAVSTKCVSSFRDVATALPKFPRYHVTKLLLGIVETCPGWITWVDPKSGENGVPISQDATVWIETLDYKRIRAKLNGEKVDDKIPPSRLKRGLISLQKTRETSRTRVPVVTVSGTKRTLRESDAPAPPTSKSLKSLTTSVVHTAAVVREANDTYSRKRASTEKPPAEEEPKSSKKRPAEDSQQENLDGQPKKKRTALRVNPNFILCDADHDGGAILQPSMELPRGLRKLFLKANAGERI
jgi:hypothetical protein